MSPVKLYLVRLLVFFIPETRGFGLKRYLYRWAGIEVGKQVKICSSAFIIGAGKLIIGDFTWLGHQVVIISTSKIEIGRHVDIAPKVCITTGSHEIDIEGERIAGRGTSNSVVIGMGSWLGASCTILPGSSIGEKSIVAAGALVNGNVADYTIVGGVPAKIIKQLK
jgi:acetyltransferase-like isoleucine patch superfamily enzyme